MATKKEATRKTTKAKVPTKSSVTAPKKKAVKKTTAKKAPARKISDEARYMMIQQAAYYLAEKHFFQADPAAIWVQAEQEVNALIGGRK